jgi:DNA-binding MarR family transcriptional regulator
VRVDTEELVHLLVHLTLQLREHERVCLETLGFTHSQARALWALRADGPLPVRALAESIHGDPSNLSTAVRELEERGLVERSPGTHDRRVRAVQLTDAGRAARRRLVECLELPSVAALAPKDRDRLLALLREVDRGRRAS